MLISHRQEANRSDSSRRTSFPLILRRQRPRQYPAPRRTHQIPTKLGWRRMWAVLAQVKRPWLKTASSRSAQSLVPTEVVSLQMAWPLGHIKRRWSSTSTRQRQHPPRGWTRVRTPTERKQHSNRVSKCPQTPTCRTPRRLLVVVTSARRTRGRHATHPFHSRGFLLILFGCGLNSFIGRELSVHHFGL